MGVSSKERAIDAALRDGHVDIVILGAGLSGVGAACVDRLIRFGCPLLRASWRSADAFRRLEAKREDGADVRLIGDFLYMCTGYNEYAEGCLPGWPGMKRFAGTRRPPPRLGRGSRRGRIARLNSVLGTRRGRLPEAGGLMTATDIEGRIVAVSGAVTVSILTRLSGS